MFRQVIFSISVFLIFVAASCERPLDLDIDEPESRLVVVSNFTNDKALEVIVSKTKSILSTAETEYILDAEVELYQGDMFLETLDLIPAIGKLNPYYITNTFRPIVNEEYNILVTAPGFDRVMAKSRIPTSINIHSFNVFNLVSFNTPEGNVLYSYNVLLGFDDPVEEENFYHLRFFQQIVNFVINEEGDTIPRGSYLQQIGFNASEDNNFLTAYFDGGVLFEDGPLNGKPISYSFPLQIQLEPRTEILGQIFVELRAVSEEYYLYHNSLSRQQSDPNLPFNEPVIVFNNIKNGQGIFAGYNSSIDSIPVID